MHKEIVCIDKGLTEMAENRVNVFTLMPLTVNYDMTMKTKHIQNVGKYTFAFFAIKGILWIVAMFVASWQLSQ